MPSQKRARDDVDESERAVKINVAEMRAKQSDVDTIKKAFDITEINFNAYIADLTDYELKEVDESMSKWERLSKADVKANHYLAYFQMWKDVKDTRKETKLMRTTCAQPLCAPPVRTPLCAPL
eukprot:5383897-Amphidinium_carterae.1